MRPAPLSPYWPAWPCTIARHHGARLITGFHTRYESLIRLLLGYAAAGSLQAGGLRLWNRLNLLARR